MRTPQQAMAAFRQDLAQHLQRGQVHPVECAAGLAEDGASVVATVDLSDGACICASFDLIPGENFDEDAREFVEDAFALLTLVECGLRISSNVSCGTAAMAW